MDSMFPNQVLVNLGPLKGYEIQPTGRHTATVIWCHGLGGNGGEYIPDVLYNLRPGLPQVKWILPNAPRREITVNMGATMPGWFDVYEAGPKLTSWATREDETGLFETVANINEIITKEMANGIPSERIFVGGISQGGTIAFATGLTSERKLGGIIVLSSYLFCRERIKKSLSPYAKSLPIFLAHGTADKMVVMPRYHLTLQFLTDEMGIGMAKAGKWKEGGIVTTVYPGLGHELCDEEMRYVRSWLEVLLPRTEEEDSQVLEDDATMNPDEEAEAGGGSFSGVPQYLQK